MVLVALKCPNCGGEVNLDDKMKSGFCIYCGTKIVNEPAPSNKIKLDTDDQFRSLVMGAKNSLIAGDLGISLDYANKALEINSELPDAWYIKSAAIRKENPKVSVSCFKVGDELASSTECQYFSKEDYTKSMYTYVDDIYKECEGHLKRVLSMKKPIAEDIEKTKIYMQRAVYVPIMETDPMLHEAVKLRAVSRVEEIEGRMSSITLSTDNDNWSKICDVYTNGLHTAISACISNHDIHNRVATMVDEYSVKLDQKWEVAFKKNGVSGSKDQINRIRNDVEIYQKWFKKY